MLGVNAMCNFGRQYLLAMGLYQFTFSPAVNRCGYSPHLHMQNRILTFWIVEALRGNKWYSLRPYSLFPSSWVNLAGDLSTDLKSKLLPSFAIFSYPCHFFCIYLLVFIASICRNALFLWEIRLLSRSYK